MAAFIAKLAIEKMQERKGKRDANRKDSSNGPPAPDTSSSSKDTTSKKGKAAGDDYAVSQSFKRGGKVKRTGLAKVHKGEEVLTPKQQKQRPKRHGKRE
jgi:hypothetical protein